MTDLAPLGYSPNAAFWVDIIRNQRDRYRTELTDPAILNAIGDVGGLSVLDVGSGEGYLSRRLAEQGATVTAVELDPELAKAAHGLQPGCGEDVEILCCDALDMPIDGNEFDVAFSNHSVNDVSDLPALMAEIARVLKPGGRLVMLGLHPCFYFQRSGLDETDPEWPSLYFTTRPREQRFNVAGIESPAPVRAWYRPLEDYFSALAGAGFAVTGLSEPHPTADMLQDPWWAANWRKPMFLLIEAQLR